MKDDPVAAERSSSVDLARESDFALGSALVRPSLGEVVAGRQTIRLQPRVMQVLVALARAGGEVVSRDELVASCWGGLAIGDDSINRCIGRLRRLAEDEAPGSFAIETLARIGYRLNPSDKTWPGPRSLPPRRSPPVRAPSWRAAIAAAALLAVCMAAALIVWGPLRTASRQPPSMRSIAILPVHNLSGDPALEPAAEALTEDTTNVMGRSGEHIVPPLSDILATKGQALDDLAKGRMLHVRYVVTASLQKQSPGLRLSYQILDTWDGHVLAASDFVDSAPDLALAERRLALRLFYGAGDLTWSKFVADQRTRPANDRDPENVQARLDALGDTDGFRRGDLGSAERLIAAAKAIPETSDLKASIEISACLTYYAMITGGYASSPAQRQAWAQDALDLGARAAQLKPLLSSPHECRVYAFVTLGRLDEAMAEAKHNLQLVPNSANAYADLATVEFARGQFQDALKDFTEVAARHEQGDPLNLGLTHLFLGDYGPAIEDFREFEVQSPRQSAGPLFNAAALELSGRHREALSQARLYLQLKTDDGSDWYVLGESREPAFLGPTSRIRRALHQLGLDEAPSSM